MASAVQGSAVCGHRGLRASVHACTTQAVGEHLSVRVAQVHVRGSAAVLLASCLQHVADEDLLSGVFNIIESRIGLDTFTDHLEQVPPAPHACRCQHIHGMPCGAPVCVCNAQPNDGDTCCNKQI
jgi:hypothetical protein